MVLNKVSDDILIIIAFFLDEDNIKSLYIIDKYLNNFFNNYCNKIYSISDNKLI